MQKQLRLRISPSAAADPEQLRAIVIEESGLTATAFTGLAILKRSVDARGKLPLIDITLKAWFNEQPDPVVLNPLQLRDVAAASNRVLIIGAGPCGLFAALKLIEAGIKPVIIERGKDVRERRRDLATLNREGIINPESNYCFGEGGAGTYSDGKLYTRSNKRGNVERILKILCAFGAPDNIRYDAHPHIGTNKLPRIISAMSARISECGGEIHFNTRCADWTISADRVDGIITTDGTKIKGDAVLLATGHSARDIFQLFRKKNLAIEFKPFALGVRVEHPQSLIDSIQYHCMNRGPWLPPAAYSLVQQVDGKGVFSFCMCPGGIIAPAASSPGELVVNGWSPSKRDNPFANSGVVVEVDQKEAIKFSKTANDQRSTHVDDPMAGMYFQQEIEQRCFEAGGGNFVAPALRLTDFVNGKLSQSLPGCSYVPGISAYPLKELLPDYINQSLKNAFCAFDQKMPGYLTGDAVVVAVESRTSAPVRIPRDAKTLQHIQIRNLYPAGEGAGYAGGIVSAAMEGERVAEAITASLSNKKARPPELQQ